MLKNTLNKTINLFESTSISYSAVVLLDEEKDKIMKTLKNQGLLDPEDIKDWKIYAHHMTINLGELPQDMKSYIDTATTLKVHSFGKSEKAIAIGVSGFFSKNSKPHVTVAVNVKQGGKPKDSNSITSWTELPRPFEVRGIVKEVAN